MLKEDHRRVERLFKQFEKTGDRAFVAKRSIVDRIIEELSAHAAIEEQLFYPAIRATVPGTEEMALESLEEHRIVKWVLSELDGMKPQDERFDAKVTVLIENVRHHVDEEESDLFPRVRGELGRKALGELGEALGDLKRIAPNHAHPRLPDEPPANLVLGAAGAVADLVGDSIAGVAQGSVNALSDLIARLLDRKPPAVSPRGSRTTRKVASRVRASAGEAADRATAKVDTAKRTGERRVTTATGTGGTTATARKAAGRTAQAAKSGAKGTVTSARRSAKSSGRRVATTAKQGATATARSASASAQSRGTAAARPAGS